MAEGSASTGIGFPGSGGDVVVCRGCGCHSSGLGRGRRTRHVERGQIVPAGIGSKTTDHGIVVGHLLGFPWRSLRRRLSHGDGRALGRSGRGFGRELTRSGGAGSPFGHQGAAPSIPQTEDEAKALIRNVFGQATIFKPVE